MDVNVKVTIDLGDKTMSLFSGFMSANNAVTAAADTAGKVLKKYADEPADERKVERAELRNARPEPAADRDEPTNEPTNEAPEPYSEDELRDMSPKDLTAILKREFDVDPDDFDGKNTNKKLRDLVLGAQAGKLEPADEPAEDARPARNAKTTDVTHDDIRDLMAEVLGADEAVKPAILKQLHEMGAKSVGTIKDEHVADFFEFLQSLKDA